MGIREKALLLSPEAPTISRGEAEGQLKMLFLRVPIQ
jgi:hypothetical protein